MRATRPGRSPSSPSPRAARWHPPRGAARRSTTSPPRTSSSWYRSQLLTPVHRQRRIGHERSAHHPAEDPRNFPALGHRGRPRHLGRILRLELRLGFGRHPRLPGDLGLRGADVHHLHLQLHRAHHGHRPRRRPLRIQPARLRAHRRLPGRLRHAGRVPLRAAGHRPGHRRLRQRAIPRARPQVGGLRRLPRLHGAQHRRHDHRRQLRARGDPDRHLRAARLHGRGGAGLLERPISSKAAGPGPMASAPPPGRASSPPSRLPSGSSWPSRAWPWPPRKPRTRAARSPSPTSAASSPCSRWPSA